MSAWWLTVDHPYFAVTNAAGRFTIRDVPPGAQRVVVWHEAVGYVKAGGAAGNEITIGAEGPTEARFAIASARITPV